MRVGSGLAAICCEPYLLMMCNYIIIRVPLFPLTSLPTLERCQIPIELIERSCRFWSRIKRRVFQKLPSLFVGTVSGGVLVRPVHASKQFIGRHRARSVQSPSRCRN